MLFSWKKSLECDSVSMQYSTYPSESIMQLDWLDLTPLPLKHTELSQIQNNVRYFHADWESTMITALLNIKL